MASPSPISTDKETLERFILLAKNEADQWNQIADSSDAICLLNSATGETKIVNKLQSSPSVTVSDIQSLVDYIHAHGANTAHNCPRIFVLPTQVVAVLDYEFEGDPDYRCHRVKLPITQSPVFDFVKRGIHTDPKSAVQALKFNLNSINTVPDLITPLTVLKFSEQATAEHSNTPADEGVSRSIRAQVSGAAAIPEAVNVAFPMYPAIRNQLEHHGYVNLNLAVSVDPSAQKVTVQPFPGEIDRITVEGANFVKQAIHKELKDLEMEHLIFLGSLDR